MQTEKLYYQDPYLQEFTAHVLKKAPLQDGRFGIVLDRTAFYPEGGGQPCDRGWLNQIPVLDVRQESDEIVHITAEDPGDDEISGRIDWQRRFDHMQQHTGEHILSGILLSRYQAENVGFHLSETTCQIDVTLSGLTPQQAGEIENEANAIIFANAPVTGQFVSAEELSRYSLRKEPGKEFAQIRLVSVAGCDCCPCGGTHVAHTGEVGLFKLRGWEKRKNHLRLDFVCGQRALADYQLKHDACRSLAVRFSVPPEGIVAAVERTLDKQESCQRELNELRKLYHQELAARLLTSVDSSAPASSAASARIIRQIFSQYSSADMQDFASRIRSQERAICLLASVDAEGDRAAFLFAGPADAALPMNELLKQSLATQGGKGGGNSLQAQGGATGCDAAKILEFAENLLLNAGPKNGDQ